MRLIRLELELFRRFRRQSILNLDGKVIAIVGPNEAGKSSLLSALKKLEKGQIVGSKPPDQDGTRGQKYDSKRAVLTATIAMPSNDASGAQFGVRWIVVRKFFDSPERTVELFPPPKRDKSLRMQIRAEIEKDSAILQRAIDQLPVDASLLTSEEILRVLGAEEDSLSEKQLLMLSALVGDAKSDEAATVRDEVGQFRDRLQELVEFERKEHPSDVAHRELGETLPSFLEFSDAQRSLASEYNLLQFYPMEKKAQPVEPPPALQNLFVTAGVNLKELSLARRSGDTGRVQELIEKANSNLNQAVASVWRQSPIKVTLHLDGQNLQILIANEGAPYLRLADRSDGLRQFLALLVFLRRYESLSAAPILLIDEAETHLHYDAQADLVNMFLRQELVSQVIYTTHSIGCLPEDLSCVRIVETEKEHSHYSVVENSFWSDDRPGYSRVLFGLGARTLDFIPLRPAILVEGGSDLVLLPVLFREVLAAEYLGFRLAPGLSSATDQQLAVVALEAPQMAYLHDGDNGGRAIARKLKRAKVPKERIFALPDLAGDACVIEDLVELDVYVSAVNEELRRSYGDGNSIRGSDVAGQNRPARVGELCTNRGLRPPAKIAVARRIVDQRWEHKLVAENAREPLLDLLERVRAVLSGETPAARRSGREARRTGGKKQLPREG